MSQKPSHFTIRQWSIDDRPREKMQQNGAQQLSNAELLALLIGSGNKEESAVHLMQRLLSAVDNNIMELHAMALEKMMEWKGIGLAKAAKIKAALELEIVSIWQSLSNNSNVIVTQRLINYSIRY